MHDDARNRYLDRSDATRYERVEQSSECAILHIETTSIRCVERSPFASTEFQLRSAGFAVTDRRIGSLSSIQQLDGQ